MSNKLVIFLCIIFFILGYKSYSLLHKHVNNLSDNNASTIVTGNITTNIKNVVKYVPKPINENTDIKIKSLKPDLVIEVNDKKTTFNVTDSENYIFDKNRLELEQSSKVNFSVTVQPVDLTKHWGIGVGYMNGLTGILTCPINNTFDFIGTVNDKHVGAGALIRF